MTTADEYATVAHLSFNRQLFRDATNARTRNRRRARAQTGVIAVRTETPRPSSARISALRLGLDLGLELDDRCCEHVEVREAVESYGLG
jgi:hypothetical protein